ncbi:MAG: bifunctional 5,10-methylenetetrahydrofolate dehydrogenase/5,10-methenyltetrahydrofolate cyclohydrolase [Thermoplasmata archaeon]|nr:bifunctional 5,10-methylenetetrahydrofolate dehydrogenase/5,10-methenyltetrahydrofolate cyclohydrolase [Thermoplasmata archaeon]
MERRTAQGAPPLQLSSVHTGGKSPFQFYLKQQHKAAERAGIRHEAVEVASPEQLLERVGELDADPSVTGVLIQHPLPAGYSFAEAIDRLRPEKDIDGAGAVCLGRLAGGRPLHTPAVALAVQELLRHFEIPVSGRRVLVLGRSPTVGLPIALLLLLRGSPGDATVQVAHTQSRELPALLQTADVVVSCAGVPGLLTRANVPPGAVVVDVGLSSVPDDSRPGGHRPAGDAAPELDGWVRALAPVPGGIGPLTVAELMQNLLRAQRAHEEGMR